MIYGTAELVHEIEAAFGLREADRMAEHRKNVSRVRRDKHQAGTGRKGREGATSQTRQVADRRLALRRWRERAKRLTGVENPTEGRIVELIEQAEGRVAGLQSRIQAAHRRGDEVTAIGLEDQRAELIRRVQELKQLRLEAR